MGSMAGKITFPDGGSCRRQTVEAMAKIIATIQYYSLENSLGRTEP